MHSSKHLGPSIFGEVDDLPQRDGFAESFPAPASSLSLVSPLPTLLPAVIIHQRASGCDLDPVLGSYLVCDIRANPPRSNR